MNRKDAEAIITLLRRLDVSSNSNRPDHPGGDAEQIAADFIKQYEGTPGTGACICQHPPAKFLQMWGTVKIEPREGTMILDHRCPEHGEVAQPALWGRYKTKELQVTREQWNSLGVEYVK